MEDAQIQALMAEIAQLRAENAQLKSQLASKPAAPSQPSDGRMTEQEYRQYWLDQQGRKTPFEWERSKREEAQNRFRFFQYERTMPQDFQDKMRELREAALKRHHLPKPGSAYPATGPAAT